MVISQWNDTNGIKKAAEQLLAEKLVLGTTDTVLGLFAPLTKVGFFLLNDIKKRNNKPYLIIMHNSDCIDDFVEKDQWIQIEMLLKSFWPGPLTIIFKAKKTVPSFMTSEKGEIALRVPHHSGMRELMKQTGPLFSTSANTTSEPVPENFEDISPQIVQNIECALIDKEKKETVPSTIISCTEISKQVITVIREGQISRKELQKSVPHFTFL